MKTKTILIRITQTIIALLVVFHANIGGVMAAEEQHTQLDFLVPDSDAVAFQEGVDGSTLLMTGGTEDNIPSGTCDSPPPRSLPVQHAIIQDSVAPNDGKKVRISPVSWVGVSSGFGFLHIARPIKQGVRLSNLIFLSSCSIDTGSGTVLYRKYRATADRVLIMTFVLPIGTPTVPGPDGDVIVFTGKPLGTATVDNCAQGEVPLHKAFIMDSLGARQEGFVEVSPISQTTAVKPGTRLGNLLYLGSCGGESYDRYVGEVE